MACGRAATEAVPPSKRAAGSAFSEKRMRVRPPWSIPSSGSTPSYFVVKRSWDRSLPLAEMGDGCSERPGQVLDAQWVSIAGRLKGRSLGGPRCRCRCDDPPSGIVGEAFEDLGHIGIDPGDGRAAQRAREVAILARGRAAFGKVEAPVGTRRYRLQAPLRGWRNNNGERRFGFDIGAAGIVTAESGQSVGLELDDLRPERCRPFEDPRPYAKARAAGVASTRFGRQSLGSPSACSYRALADGEAGPRTMPSRSLPCGLGRESAIKKRTARRNRAACRRAVPGSAPAISASKRPCSEG